MSRAFVSAGIITVLLLQLLATFDLYPTLVSRPSAQFWPFTDYPMYRYTRHEGAVIEWFRVLAQRADGSEVELQPADLGLNFRKFLDIVVTAVRIGDVDTIARFGEVYARRHGAHLNAVRLERQGVAVMRDGVRNVPVTYTDPIEVPRR